MCLQDALEWALYVQELLMWQPWPQRLLALPSFKEVAAAADAANGSLPLFRGPRYVHMTTKLVLNRAC
jgi:hypothetical protein